MKKVDKKNMEKVNKNLKKVNNNLEEVMKT